MKPSDKLPIFYIGITLKNLRHTLMLPQKALAPILEVSQATYSRLENEEKELSPELFEKIIKAVGIDIGDSKNQKELTNEAKPSIYNIENNSLKDLNTNDSLRNRILELKKDNKELKKLNKFQQEQIQKLWNLLEVKSNL